MDLTLVRVAGPVAQERRLNTLADAASNLTHLPLPEAMPNTPSLTLILPPISMQNMKTVDLPPKSHSPMTASKCPSYSLGFPEHSWKVEMEMNPREISSKIRKLVQECKVPLPLQSPQGPMCASPERPARVRRRRERSSLADYKVLAWLDHMDTSNPRREQSKTWCPPAPTPRPTPTPRPSPTKPPDTPIQNLFTPTTPCNAMASLESLVTGVGEGRERPGPGYYRILSGK